MLKDILIPRAKRALKKEMQALKDECEDRVFEAEKAAKEILPKIESNLEAFKECVGRLNTLQEKVDKRQEVLDGINEKRATVQKHDDTALAKVADIQSQRDAQFEVFQAIRKQVLDGRKVLNAKIADIEERVAVVDLRIREVLEKLSTQIEELRKLLSMQQAEHDDLADAIAALNAVIAKEDSIVAETNQTKDKIAGLEDKAPQLLQETQQRRTEAANVAAAIRAMSKSNDTLQREIRELQSLTAARGDQDRSLEKRLEEERKKESDFDKKITSAATLSIFMSREQTLAGFLARAKKADAQHKTLWGKLRAANEQALSKRAAARDQLAAALLEQRKHAAQKHEAEAMKALQVILDKNEELQKQLEAVDSELAAHEEHTDAVIADSAGAAQQAKATLSNIRHKIKMRREEQLDMMGSEGTDYRERAERQAAVTNKIEHQEAVIAQLQQRKLDAATSLRDWSSTCAEAQVKHTENVSELQQQAAGAVVEVKRAEQLLQLALDEFEEIRTRESALKTLITEQEEKFGADSDILRQQQAEARAQLVASFEDQRAATEERSTQSGASVVSQLKEFRARHAQSLKEIASKSSESQRRLRELIRSADEDKSRSEAAAAAAKLQHTDAIHKQATAKQKLDEARRLQEAMALAPSPQASLDTAKRKQGSRPPRRRKKGKAKADSRGGAPSVAINPEKQLLPKLDSLHGRMSELSELVPTTVKPMAALERAIEASRRSGNLRSSLQADTAAKLQSVIRARRVRAMGGEARIQFRGARLIQSFWRGRVQRFAYLIVRTEHRRQRAATHLQSLWRMYSGKLRVAKIRRDILENASAVVLQALWRCISQQKRYHEMLIAKARSDAATQIQKVWRAYAAKLLAERVRETNLSDAERAQRQARLDAITALQSITRGRRVRRAAAAVKIQRIARGRVQQRKFRFQKFYSIAVSAARQVQITWRRQMLNFIADDAADMLVLLKQHDDDTGFQWLKHRSDFLEEVHQRTAKTVSAADSGGRRAAQTLAAAKFVYTTLKIKARQMDGSIDGDAANLMVLMKEWKDIIKGDKNFKFEDFSVTQSLQYIRQHPADVPDLFRLARIGNTENVFK